MLDAGYGLRGDYKRHTAYGAREKLIELIG